MKRYTVFLFVLIIASATAAAWDRSVPDTYDATVKSLTQTKIPEVNFNAPIIRVIPALATFPIRIDVSQVEEKRLHENITIKKKQISCIEIIALIADQLDADILISKGTVILMPSNSHRANEG